MIKSEVTKNMPMDDVLKMQDIVSKMNPLELKQFRNSYDPDIMGFYGEEAADEEE